MDWEARVEQLIATLEKRHVRVRRRRGSAGPEFGCAELDAFCAAIEHLEAGEVTLDCDEFGQDDAYDYETVFTDSGLQFDQIGDLIRLTDEGVGPDGYFVEAVGERARVWRIGHDPYLAEDHGPLLAWLAGLSGEPFLTDDLEPPPALVHKRVDPTVFGPFSFHGRRLRYRHADGTEESYDLVLDTDQPVIGPWPPVIGRLLGRLVLSVPVGGSTRRFPIPTTWDDAQLRRFRSALTEAREAKAISQGFDW